MRNLRQTDFGRNASIRAFTLIEIMITTVILGLVIASIYGSWSAVLRGARTGSKAAEEAQRARIAMQTVEDALMTSQMFVENIRYYSFVADTASDPDLASLTMVSRLPANFPGGAIFGDLSLRRVTFTVEEGTNSPANLVLRQVPVVMVDEEFGEEYAITLARDVSFFRLEFLDDQLGEWVPEWFNTNQMPRMVRVALGVGETPGNSDVPKQLLTRVIAPPSSAILPEYQTFGGTQNQNQQPPPPPAQPGR